MKKKIFSIAIFLLLALSIFAGGAKESATPENAVSVMVPNGPPTICIAKMINENPDLGLPTKYATVKSTDLMQARVISGEADIAIVPTNLASVLYSKGIEIKLAGTVAWGLLYGVTTEEINSLQDLKGKTILTLGRGLTPDLTIREILIKAGLKPDEDVFLKYVQANTELAPMFIMGKSTIAVVPEPMLSMILSKKKNAKIFLDVQKEWKERVGGDSSYPQASLIISNKLINENPEYVKNFIASLDESISWAMQNPKEAGEVSHKIMKDFPAKILAKGIERMNLEWKAASLARPAIEKYFDILKKSNPKFIGGKLPDDAFYLEIK